MYSDALEAVPNDSEVADLQFNIGNVLERLGRDGAEKAYRESVARDPSHLAARNNLALLLLRRGDAEGAVNELRMGLSSNRENTAEARNNLGIALEKCNLVEEAMEAYEIAIDASKGMDARPLTNLGSTLSRLADETEDDEMAWNFRDRALKSYRSAALLAPFDADLRFNVAAALDESGDLVEAIAEYRAAIAIDPDHSIAHNNLGLALEELENFEEALSHFRRAVDVDPKDGDTWFNRANLAAKCQYTDEALDAYARAAATDSAVTFQAHEAAANVAAQVGKIQLAIDHAKAARKAAIDTDDKQRASQLLRHLLEIWRETQEEDLLS